MDDGIVHDWYEILGSILEEIQGDDYINILQHLKEYFEEQGDCSGV